MQGCRPRAPQPRALPPHSPPLNIPSSCAPAARSSPVVQDLAIRAPRGFPWCRRSAPHRGAPFRTGKAGTPASPLLHGSLSIPLQQQQPEGFLTWAFPWQRSKMAPGTGGLLGAVARQPALPEQGYGGEGLRVPGQRTRLLTLQVGWEMPEPLCWGWSQDQHPQLMPQGRGVPVTGSAAPPCCAVLCHAMPC